MQANEVYSSHPRKVSILIIKKVFIFFVLKFLETGLAEVIEFLPIACLEWMNLVVQIGLLIICVNYCNFFILTFENLWVFIIMKLLI